MRALAKLTTLYLIAPVGRSWAKLQRLTRSEIGSAIGAAAVSFVVAIGGGLDCLLNELQLTRNRLRTLSRDEAGYTTQTVIMTALLAALAIAAGAIIYTKVINKANSINLDGNSGSGS
jgi:hypothetical protein